LPCAHDDGGSFANGTKRVRWVRPSSDSIRDHRRSRPSRTNTDARADTNTNTNTNTDAHTGTGTNADTAGSLLQTP
jgi:hypothetical protein